MIHERSTNKQPITNFKLTNQSGCIVPIYGYQIRWTIPGLGREVASVFGYTTPQAAVADAVVYARALGWTPPRWWQFWRWRDTKITE